MKLKKWLDKNKISPATLALEIDMSKSTVYHWLKKIRHPTRRAKLAIMKFTNNQVTLEDWNDE